MPIRSIEDLRQQAAAAGVSGSDEDLMREYSRRTGTPPSFIANAVGYSPDSGMWGARGSAAVDRYQGSLYDAARGAARGLGLPGAADWLDQRRRENEFAADVSAERAQAMGAIDSYKDVDWFSPRSVGNYVGGLAVQSLPYVGEAVAGGLVGGPVGAAAGFGRAALPMARRLGAVAASIPSSAGDIMSNQREQVGYTDDAAAFGLAPAYAALNAVGLEGAAATGRLARLGRAGDAIPGVMGGAARTVKNVGLGFGIEGATETGQEVINQFGRMSVDPSATLTSGDAMDRYAESFIGGGILGGGAAGVMGGWRQSDAYTADQIRQAREAAEREAALQRDLLNPAPPGPSAFDAVPPPALGWNGQFGLNAPGVMYAGAGPDAQAYGELDNVYQPEQPFTYQGGMDFEPTMPPMGPQPRPAGIQIPPVGYDVPQRELFTTHGYYPGTANGFEEVAMMPWRQPETGLPYVASQPQPPTPRPAPEPDMTAPLFDQQPTTLVRTDFGLPAIRQSLVAAAGGMDSWTAKLATTIDREIEQPDVLAENIADLRDRIERSKLSQPTIDKRLAALDAADSLVQTYRERMADAAGQEAAIGADTQRFRTNVWARQALARGGEPTVSTTAPIGPARPQDTTEGEMRRRSAAELDAEQRFYDEVQAEENALRSTPNEMDPNLVPERGSRARRPNLVLRSEDGPVRMDFRQEAPAPAPDTLTVPMFGPRGGVTKDALRTGPKDAPPARAARTSPQGVEMSAAPPAAPVAEPTAPTTAAPAVEPEGRTVLDAVEANRQDWLRLWQEAGQEVERETAVQAAPTERIMTSAAPIGGSAPAGTARAAAAPRPRTAPKMPEAPKAVARHADALAQAEEDFAALQHEYEAVSHLPQSARSRRLIEDRYFEALARVNRERATLGRMRLANRSALGDAIEAVSEQSSAPETAPAAPETATAPLTREQIQAKLAEPVTEQGRREATAGKAAVEQEETEMLEGSERRYRSALRQPTSVNGVHSLERSNQRKEALRRYAREIYDLATEGSTTRVRSAAKKVLDDIVQEEHYESFATLDHQLSGAAAEARTLGALLDVVRREGGFEVVGTDGVRKTNTASGRLLDLANRLNRVRNMRGIRVAYVDEVSESKTSTPEKKQAKGGHYDPKTNTVTLYRGTTVRIALHEAVHAATVHAMYDHIDKQGNAKTDLGKEAIRLMGLASEQAKKDGFGDAYAFTNIYEFIAEAFTNEQFQRWMGKYRTGTPTQFKPSQLWADFLDLLRRLLNLPAQAVTLLDEVITVGSLFMDGPNETTQDVEGRPELDTMESPAGNTALDDTARFDIPEPNEVGRMQHAFKTVTSALTDWRNMPGALGWLSLRQIRERFKSPTVQKYVDYVMRSEARAQQLAHKIAQVVTPWRNLPEDLQVKLGRVALEATLLRGHIDRDWDHESNDHLRDKNDELWTDKNESEFKRVKAMYDTLPPKVQELYKAGRDTMQELWNLRAAAKLQEIKRAYMPELQEYISDEAIDELIKSPKSIREAIREAAREAPMPMSAKRALRSLLQDADAHWQEKNSMRGPYFPLVRFGDHVVVMKSGTFKKAHERFIATRDALQKLYDREPPDNDTDAAKFEAELVEARRTEREARAALELLKGSIQHYAVRFFENRWEAEAYERQLKGDPVKGIEPDPIVKQFGLDVYIDQRSQHYLQFDSASPQFMRRLENSLRQSMPKADVNAVRNAVRDVYIRSLPDRAALKSELRRLNVRGAKSTEMMRGFAQRGIAHGNAIARMENNGAIHEALNELRSSESRDEKLVGEEFALRNLKSLMPPERNKVFERMAQAAHLTFLGMSPSYFMINAAQPWAISTPIMAARHGWFATGRELGKATQEVMQSMRAMRAQEAKGLKDAGVPFANARSFRFDLQPELLGKTEDEQQMITTLFNDGLINITIEHDIGAVAGGDEQNWFDKANQIAATPAHLVEMVNRVATALAAYRLQTRDGVENNSHADGVAYATQVVADTHLDYTAENAPRLMRPDAFGGLGRLLFQFKKYMQGMLYLNAKLLLDSFKVIDKDSPAQVKAKREARKAVAYLWGMTAGVAGASGLPIAGGFSLLLKAVEQLWDDDDEPDLSQMLYNGMKDAVGETAARALVKGLPAAVGVDVSTRMGMAGLTNPGQFVDWSKDGRDLWANIMMSMAGPASAMVGNWFDAAQVASSDPMRAAQLAMPKALSDPLKAISRADRGIISRSGNEVVPPDEFNAAMLTLRGLGFETTKISDMYDQRASLNSAKTAKDAVRKKLIRQYLEAKSGDEDVGPVMDKIAAFNDRNPNDRILMSTLIQSAKRKDQNRQDMVSGAVIGRRYRDVLDSAGAE